MESTLQTNINLWKHVQLKCDQTFVYHFEIGTSNLESKLPADIFLIAFDWPPLSVHTCHLPDLCLLTGPQQSDASSSSSQEEPFLWCYWCSTGIYVLKYNKSKQSIMHSICPYMVHFQEKLRMTHNYKSKFLQVIDYNIALQKLD